MQQVSKVLKVWQDRKVKLLEIWTASIFRNVIFVLTELLHVYFGRSNVVFAILFCFVQNKFVFCKAIVGFYFGIVRDDVLAVIVSEKTRNYQSGIKMFSIIFNKKARGISNFYLGCLIHNLQFFIDKLIYEEKEEFLKSFQGYVKFLEEIHYPLHESDVMVKYEKYGIKTKNTIECNRIFL